MSSKAEDLKFAGRKAAGRSLGRMPARLVDAAERAIGPYELDGYRLDPHLRLAMKAAAAEPSLDTLDPVEARRTSKAGFAASNAQRVEGVSVTPTIIPDPKHGDLDARVYTPAGASAQPRPGVLFLHQGGWVIGDLDTCDTFCTQLASGLDAIVVSLDYRLAPEHRFPTQNENVDAAWDWMIEAAPHLGIDPAQMVVCGDSAGGQLSASLCQRLRDAGRPNPAAQVLIYPTVDLAAKSGSMISCADAFPLTANIGRYFVSFALPEGAEHNDPAYSPAQHPHLEGLAPAIIITAAFDILRDQGLAFAKQLDAAGVPVISRLEPEMSHSFISMGALSPAAYEASERIVADIATVLKAGK